MMGQRQREQVQRGCVVGTVVLLAWLCRVFPLEGLPSGLQDSSILLGGVYLSTRNFLGIDELQLKSVI